MKGLTCLKKNAKEFLIKAGKRAAHTAAQVALATIGTATMVEQVGWKALASTIALSVIISLLKSIIVGLPEMEV